MSGPVKSQKSMNNSALISNVSPESLEGSMTEEELSKKEIINPEDVLRLNKPTTGYLCSVEANTYEIEFVHFKLRDIESSTVLFEVSKPENVSPKDEDALESGRFVRYQFTPEFLQLKTVGATVEFRIGDKPVENFRMIEKHYFKDTLLKSFDFEFGFVIPNSRNTMEHIYNFPEIEPELITEMIERPFETRSDSFYFVDGQLVMHNKADYAYDADVSSA